MNPVPPKALASDQRFVIIARDQKEYRPLPAGVSADGTVMVEFEFSAEDLALVMAGGRLRLWVWTFGRNFQPIKMEITE